MSGIIHRSTNQVFTSDALSRAIQNQLEVDSDDPMLLTICHHDASDEQLTRALVRHCRHETRKYGPFHPLEVCGPLINVDRLMKCVKGEPRLTLCGNRGTLTFTALYGHTLGMEPQNLYKEYLGPSLWLQHWTTEHSLSKIIKKGLSPIIRRYVHLSTTSKRNHWRTHVLFVFSGQLTDSSILVFV